MKAYRLESCAASSAYAWKITYVTEDLDLMKTIYQRFHCPCTHSGRERRRLTNILDLCNALLFLHAFFPIHRPLFCLIKLE